MLTSDSMVSVYHSELNDIQKDCEKKQGLNIGTTKNELKYQDLTNFLDFFFQSRNHLNTPAYVHHSGYGCGRMPEMICRLCSRGSRHTTIKLSRGVLGLDGGAQGHPLLQVAFIQLRRSSCRQARYFRFSVWVYRVF